MDRKKVENILMEMGIPPSIKGFGYIADAMDVFGEKGTCIKITTELYPVIAKRNKSTASRVERAIRHAFEIARSEIGNHEAVSKYIGFASKKNSASLTMLYKRIEQELKERGGEEDDKEARCAGEFQLVSEMQIRKIIRQELVRMFGESAKAGLKD